MNNTILNESLLKPVAVIILFLFVVTGSYWGYIKYFSINNKKAIPVSLRTEQQKENAQSQAPDHVFDIIRKANVTKDIDLFMSCYSPKFKSLDDKKAGRLKIWNKYEYNSLTYNNKGFIILKNKASGMVEWQFYARSKNMAKIISATTLYNVVLERDHKGAWKIIFLMKL